MSIERCIRRMVERGELSKKLGEQALGLYRGAQAHLRDGMPPASTDAAAALKIAEILEAGARAKKLQVAKQAIVHDAAKQRVAAHPKGKVAGVQSLLTRDIYGTGGESIETNTETIFGDLLRRFEGGIKEFRPKLLGLRSTDAARGIDRMIDELFKVETGDQVARQAAAHWIDATDAATTRATAGGKIFAELEDWRLPQYWDSHRVKSLGRDAFMGDLRAAISSGGLKVWDRDAADFAGAIRTEELLGKATEDIVADQGAIARAFDARTRLFRFQDGKDGADAFKGLMTKYGAGTDLFGPMVEHLRGAAREIALIETLGPQYRASFNALLADAARTEALTPTQRSAGETFFLSGTGQTSLRATQRTFDHLTGRSNAVESEVMAGGFSALRSWMRMAQLGSAVLAAVPGDTATAVMAARFNGLPAGKVISRAIEGLLNDEQQRQIATRMGIVSHAAIESALSAQRYQDEWLTTQKVARLGGAGVSILMRAQGMTAWTESIRRAFSMEFLAHLAEHSGKAMEELHAPLRGFLERYNFTPTEWDALRATEQLDVDGAKFFLPSAVADRKLGERLLGAILDERQFAVLEPNSRTSQLSTVAGPRGTFMSEMIQSGPLMYKSFPVQMILTHGMRAAQQADWSSRAGYGMAVLATTTMAGALTLQAKSVVSGRDPRDMSMPTFWSSAMLTGGALGIYGDLFSTGLTQEGGQAVEAVFGPIASLMGQATRGVASIRNSIDGDGRTFGAWLANLQRYNMPGSKLWYARLGIDRYLHDQVQMMLDPEYRQSFRRVEQRAEEDFGQEYWFGPGETLPERGPQPARFR